MNFFISTLGCKVNQYESQAMLENLINCGFSLSESEDTADIFILNSCTVTASSDQKTRKLVRYAKRQNPNVIVDGSHNDEAIDALIESLKSYDYDRLIVGFSILKDKDFKYIIPGGSVMSGCGTGALVSLSNCFVIGSPKDSYAEIM